MINQNKEAVTDFEMTKLGALPHGWKVVELGSVTDVKGGKRLPKGNSFSKIPTKFPYIRVTDFRDWSVTLSDLKYLTHEDAEFLKRYTISSEDAYISIAGTIGLVGTVPEELDGANLTENAAKLVIDNNEVLDKSFLVAFLASNKGQNEIEQRTTKTSQPKLALARIKQIPIPIPPLSEQKNIATVLSAVQEAKENTVNVIRAAKELKKSLMKYLFTYGAVPVNKVDCVSLRETKIGIIPTHWHVGKFGDCATVITKGSSPRWQGFEYCDKGILFIRSQNIGLGRLELTDTAHLPESFNSKEKRSIIQCDDLLINIVGASIGRAAVANKTIDGANVNQAVAIVRLSKDCKATFMSTYLLTENGQLQLHQQKKDIARANLSLTDIRNLFVPLPPFDEQERIADILSSMQMKIETEETKRNYLEQLFKSLVHKLMTGKVRVKDLEV